MEENRKTLIDVLLEKNRLTSSEASNFAKNLTNNQIEAKLLEKKLVTPEDIAKAYAVIYDLPYIRLENYEVSKEAFDLVPIDLIKKYKIVCFEKVEDKKIKIAIGDPGQIRSNKPQFLDDLKQKKGIQIDLYVTTNQDVQKVVTRLSQAKPAEVTALKREITYPQLSHLKTVDLKAVKIPYDVISKFPIEVSKKYSIVVFESPEPNLIRVAVSDPSDAKVQEILDFVRDRNEINIEEFVASPTEISEAINQFYKKPSDSTVVEEVMPKPLQDLPQKPAEPAEPASAPSSAGINLKNLFTKKSDETSDSAELPDVTKIPVKNTNVAVAPGTPNAPVKDHQGVNETERRRFVRRPIPFQTLPPEGQPAPEENAEATAMIAPENDLDKFLGQPVENIETLKNIIQTGNVPHILAATVALAVFMKASDIHIESDGVDLRFRFRVDGVLKDIIKMPIMLQPALISRVKILSRLKIDEARVPQDGRFDVKTQGHEIDLRVSTLPTVRGEKAALRILDKSQNIYTLEELGFTDRNLKMVEENITKPYGVILSTGPTGSGKSTTLYSILKKISSPSVNVITLEDPVEYEMPGINQCQVKPKIGFSFAEGLRSVLRQDPNIIMVGEIRDAETAGMATHAALTGHLVLTTLHTNDAAGALPRLTNMGIEPFLITSSINLVIGQRLVRKICQKCKHEVEVPPEYLPEIEKELTKFNLPKPYRFYEGTGCPECTNGFSGRIGIYEVLVMSEKIESLAIQRRPSSEIKAAAVQEGMTTMKQDGLLKAIKGVTTISEVLRVTLTE